MNTIKVPIEIFRHAFGPKFEIPQFGDFIFQEFKLEVDGADKTKPFFIVDWQKQEEQSMIFTFYQNGKKLGRYQWLMHGNDITRGALLKIPPSDFQEKEREAAFLAAMMVLFYMGYIMNYPREHTRARLSSHRYSHEHKVSTAQNKIYLFDDIVKYVSEKYVPEGGHHSIQCPCWEVRGHYRHYKSGKVVFIQSYRKGKDKDTTQPMPKEYIASQRKDCT